MGEHLPDGEGFLKPMELREFLQKHNNLEDLLPRTNYFVKVLGIASTSLHLPANDRQVIRASKPDMSVIWKVKVEKYGSDKAVIFESCEMLAGKPYATLVFGDCTKIGLEVLVFVSKFFSIVFYVRS